MSRVFVSLIVWSTLAKLIPLFVSCNGGGMLKNKGELSDFANHSKSISALVVFGIFLIMY